MKGPFCGLTKFYGSSIHFVTSPALPRLPLTALGATSESTPSLFCDIHKLGHALSIYVKEEYVRITM